MTRWLLSTLTLLGLLAACDARTVAPSPTPVSTVSIGPSVTTLVVGETLQLGATAFAPDGEALDGRAFEWSTEDATIATVSTTGLVSAHAAGEVRITATSEGVHDAVVLTVTTVPLPVDWIEVDPAGEYTLAIDGTLDVDATLYAANGEILTGRAVTWESSDPSVASVTTSGHVTAHDVGTAWIAATCEGLRDEMLIRVSSGPLAVDSVTLNFGEASMDLGATVQLVATTLDANGEPIDRPIAWSSDTPSVATVGTDGLVSGVGSGSALITAESEGKTATARIFVSGWATYALTSVNGQSFPVPIRTHTVTIPGDTTRTFTEWITAGTLRIHMPDDRYELDWTGRRTSPGLLPVPIAYSSRGAVTWDSLAQTYTFVPDDGTMQSSSGAFAPGAKLEIEWQPVATENALTFGFQMP